MKHMRKIIALVIAMVMTIAMSVTVFAEDVTVSINSTPETGYAQTGDQAVTLSGHNFKATQILVAENYDDDETSETYKQYSNFSWGKAVTNPATLLTALQADSTLGFGDYAATATEGKELFTAASFASVIGTYGDDSDKAKALAIVLRDYDGFATAGQTTLTGGAGTLPSPGYYLIDDITTLGNNDVANPVTLFAAPGQNKIKIKTEKPTQEKKVKENVKYTDNTESPVSGTNRGAGYNDVADYQIGDTVPFEILSKVPNMTNFTNYDITFTDTMSDGLTFDSSSLVVSIGGTALAATAYTVKTTDIGTATFTVNIVLKAPAAGETAAINYTAGDEIKLAFNATLNANAEIGKPGNPNTSKLTYSNNPDDTTSHTDTPDDTVIVFTYELDVTKVDGANEETKLKGAQFKLANADQSKWAVVYNGTEKVTIDGVEYTPAKGTIKSWADTIDDASILESDSDGLFKIYGLDDGTYYLKETKAPTGYNLLANPIKLTVVATTNNGQNGGTAADLQAIKINVDDEKVGGDGDDKNNLKFVDGNVATGTVATTVKNNSGSELPSTGGIGTTIFYVIGAVLVLGAGIILVTRRRMSVN